MDQQAATSAIVPAVDGVQSTAAASSAVETAANAAEETVANSAVEQVASSAASILNPVGATTAIVASAVAAQVLPHNGSAPIAPSTGDPSSEPDTDSQTSQPLVSNPSTATSGATSQLSPSRASSDNQYLHPAPNVAPSIDQETQPPAELTDESAIQMPTEAVSNLRIDVQPSKRRVASDPASRNPQL